MQKTFFLDYQQIKLEIIDKNASFQFHKYVNIKWLSAQFCLHSILKLQQQLIDFFKNKNRRTIIRPV